MEETCQLISSTVRWDRSAGSETGNKPETFWSADRRRDSAGLKTTQTSCRKFHKCYRIVANFSQNTDFPFLFCFVSLVWTRPKATNTLSEYAILTAFPLQQWLHECSSMLRCTHFKLRVLFVSNKTVAQTLNELLWCDSPDFCFAVCGPGFSVNLNLQGLPRWWNKGKWIVHKQGQTLDCVHPLICSSHIRGWLLIYREDHRT